jgi:nicotinamide riboside kinase
MPVKIVVTGPESTGKTALCTQLSARCKGTMIPEFSRVYLHKLDRPYHLEDVENIGLTQNKHNAVSNDTRQILICDTDALTTYIWAKEKFDITSSRLEEAFKRQLPDLYLLCYPDLQWEQDPLRENPKDLERLFLCYLKEIVDVHAPYAIITGIGESRINQAIFFIKNQFPEIVKFAF